MTHLTRLALVPLALCLLAAADWMPYSSSDGKYKISFPGKAMETTQDLPGGLGKMKMAVLESAGGAFLASHMPMPFPGEPTEEQIKTVLSATAKGVAGSQKGGKITAEKEIKLDNKYLGRDVFVTFTLPDGKPAMLNVRIFIADKTLYQTMVLGPEDVVKSKDAEQFLKSFELTKK